VDISESKALVEWARTLKVKKLKLGELEVEFSDLAFLDTIEFSDVPTPRPPSEPADLLNPELPQDDPDLYYSTR